MRKTSCPHYFLLNTRHSDILDKLRHLKIIQSFSIRTQQNIGLLFRIILTETVSVKCINDVIIRHCVVFCFIFSFNCMSLFIVLLAHRTNGRAYATVLHLSVRL